MRWAVATWLITGFVVLGFVALYGATAFCWWKVRRLRAQRRRGFVLGGRRYFPVGNSDVWVEEDASDGAIN